MTRTAAYLVVLGLLGPLLLPLCATQGEEGLEVAHRRDISESTESRS